MYGKEFEHIDVKNQTIFSIVSKQFTVYKTSLQNYTSLMVRKKDKI